MSFAHLTVIFAQERSGAYQAGRIAGIIFLVVLLGAIIWRMAKK